MAFPVSMLFTLAEPAADDYFVGSDHEPFTASDRCGRIYAAQIELNQAWQMLEVLTQLAAESRHEEGLPLEGWAGLLLAVQERVGRSRRLLDDWQQAADVGPAGRA